MIRTHFKTLLLAGLLASLLSSCKDDDSTAKPKMFTYTTATNWNCDGNFCQDVWEIHLVKGTTASFTISELTGGSVGQIALYAPGVALGGTNLLTNNTNELGCFDGSDCDNGVTGVMKEIEITVTGTYKFVATRNNNESCGSSGNYSLEIISTTETPSQILDNAVSVAPETATCI